MNDNLVISYQLFSDLINLLDQLAEFMRIEIEHVPAPALFHIKPYLQLEQGYNTLRDLERERKLNEAVAMMQRLFDETADQIQYTALDFEE